MRPVQSANLACELSHCSPCDVLEATKKRRRNAKCASLAPGITEGSILTDQKGAADPVDRRRMALSRWENEGGSTAYPQLEADAVPELTNAELVHLRIRVIALENLVIALLANGSDGQLATAREMAAYISPRPGFTPHPLTVQAANHIVELVDRAVHYQGLPAT